MQTLLVLHQLPSSIGAQSFGPLLPLLLSLGASCLRQTIPSLRLFLPASACPFSLAGGILLILQEGI